MGTLKGNRMIPTPGVYGLSPRIAKPLTKVDYQPYNIGDIIKKRGKIFKIVEAEKKAHCRGCYFYNEEERMCYKDIPVPCVAYNRYDQTWVIFKEVDNGLSK